MPAIKKQRLSRKVQAGQTANRTTAVSFCQLNRTSIAREAAAAQERYHLNIAGLSTTSRNAIHEMRKESPVAADEAWEDVAVDMPPLPEGVSHEETIIHAIRDYMHTPHRQTKDSQTWRLRQRSFHDTWAQFLPSLVTAYTAWRSGHGTTPAQSPPASPAEDYSFTIPILDIYTLQAEVHASRSQDGPTAIEALLRLGFVGNAPYNPSLAISLKTLELYCIIRSRKPSFSAESFTKVLCDCYAVPYHRTYRRALSDTFDVYLAISHEVERQVNVILGRDGPDWRVLNACPPCSFQLEGEPDLQFSRLYVMDGGNSAKQMVAFGEREAGDLRCMDDSDYLIPRVYVDKLTRQAQSNHHPSHAPDDEISLSASSADDPVGVLDDNRSPLGEDCSKTWKAGASDKSKRMWAIFEETGIFVAVCRHGLMLWYVDMIRSGELAKYPLAIVSKILEVVGERTLGAYDIGCRFKTTIQSSLIGPNFQNKQSRLCVDSFHGYAHNYTCQTQNHPLGIEGAGLEDFGFCERLFSASNALTPIIRYASRFHRHQALDLFFKQWDEERYSNLGTMLLNNYRQAQGIVSAESIALEEAMHSLCVTPQELEKWRAEEMEYFRTLGQEREYDAHAVVYVELLQQLRKLEGKFSSSFTQFVSAVPDDYQFNLPRNEFYVANLSQTRKLETQQRHDAEKLEDVRQAVISMEVKLGIARWEPSSPEYQATLRYVKERKYHRALDHLQHLIVQRLFELQWLNVSNTAYKMRTHISKALRTRCHAIQNAVKKYNEAAAELEPPRPALDWSRVSHISFLEEFGILKYTHEDVRKKPWTKPAICETIRQYLRIQRAREEIVRCNIEVRRLLTAIHAENAMFEHVLSDPEVLASPLLPIIHDITTRRRRINDQLLVRIKQIHELEGFSGESTCGVKIGSGPRCDVDTSSSLPHDVMQTPGHTDAEEEDIESEDEERERDIDALINYISDLALSKE